MKEFFELLKRFDFKGLFVTPTQNGFLQFFRYLFVGGVATVVDWGVLFGLTELCNLHPLISAAIGFMAGLLANFLLSKLLVFSGSEARTGKLMEFLGYVIIGLVGLGLTELILYVCTAFLTLHYMIAKIIATALVLIWNYLARKKLLYKG